MHENTLIKILHVSSKNNIKWSILCQNVVTMSLNGVRLSNTRQREKRAMDGKSPLRGIFSRIIQTERADLLIKYTLQVYSTLKILIVERGRNGCGYWQSGSLVEVVAHFWISGSFTETVFQLFEEVCLSLKKYIVHFWRNGPITKKKCFNCWGSGSLVEEVAHFWRCGSLLKKWLSLLKKCFNRWRSGSLVEEVAHFWRSGSLLKKWFTFEMALFAEKVFQSLKVAHLLKKWFIFYWKVFQSLKKVTCSLK